MTPRREFLRAVAVAGAGLLATRALAAQQVTPAPSAPDSAAPAQGTTSNLFDMNQDAAKSVRRPPKRDAAPSMTADARDGLEHQIRCQCSCTLDVYTCRTTDFSCDVSPAMHRDAMALVAGGYSAQEILDAFVDTYGEKALMAPKREGFNLAGYIVPFVALGGGAVALVAVLRRMQQRATLASSRSAVTAAPPTAPGASAAEMDRLAAAIRRDD